MSLVRKSQNKNLTSSKEENLYFKEVLGEAGIKLKKDDDLNVVVQEQSLIIRDMEKSIRIHVNYPNNIKMFINGLKSLCNDENNFQKALSSTSLQKSVVEELIQSNVKQDSLFRIMLNVNCIQTEVIEILLDKLTNLVCKETEDTSDLRLILNALRYLPYIAEPLQLTTKILDALEIATKMQQLEIMNFIPDIVPDNQCDEAAKQLSKLLEDSDDLAGAIIDCLNALHFSATARATIQEYIVGRLLTSKRYYKIFPILFEFLITDYRQEHITNVLLKCRNTLDVIMNTTDKENIDIVSIKVMIFKKLQYLVCIRKNLFEALINMINTIKVPNDHKPVDLLLLFMLHSACKAKKKNIEQFFKKRIKSSLFKISLFEKTFEKYLEQQIVDDYVNSMIEIAASLLRSHNDVTFIETGSIIFKLLFINEKTTKVHRHEILFNLIMLTGSNEEKNASAVLCIFQDLTKEPKLREHTNQLMGLLDKLENLHLKNVKKMFEILCRLTCAEDIGDTQTGLKDELNILVRKQLSTFKREVKSRGIIGAIVMAKHIAAISENESISSDTTADDTIINVEDLPKGAAHEAATLLNLANTCVRGVPDMMSLYYDQVASMLVSADHLNKHFMNWLFEIITRDFQDFFIIQNTPEPINDVILTAQYCINTNDELEEAISVNIAELSMKSSTSQNNILILSPLFRLLRILHQKQNKGDLSSIDALEGCGVIMPEVEDIEKLQFDQMKQVCDCIFHCVNWFREIVSAFVTQTNKTIRKKIIIRLMNLIELEELLNKYMSIIPDHRLPISYYGSYTKGPPIKNVPKKISHKRLKSNAIVNDTIASTSATQVGTQVKPTQSSKRITKICDNDYKFREIDVDVILLLKYPLDINKTIDENSTSINIKQFQFILKDFVNKLTILTKNKDVGLSDLNIVDPVNLILDSRKLIPNMNKQTKVIISHISELIATVDEQYDSPDLFSESANDLKLGFALSLEFSAIIFGWVGFQNDKNLNLLQDCLKGFRDTQSSQVFATVYRFIIEHVNRLFTYIDQCLYLPSAVSIIEIMQSLYKVHPVPEVKKVITAASQKLLKKRWYDLSGKLETGKSACANIEVLVKAHLGNTKIKTMCGIVATLQTEVFKLKAKTDHLPMLESIDKGNFYIFYRSLCGALSKHVRNEVTSLTNNEHLILWRTTVLTMQGLMTIAKVHETKTNLVCFLRNSIDILKTFLSHGIPILEMMLKSKSDQVLEIFKIMQTSTRFLHHLCCYSKVTKDAGLINLVPQFRLTLETLLYRVKAALAANNCSQAFWMGNLKNRDLQGDDILSQSTVTTENDGSNDELSAAESNEDVDMINDTASQVYGMEENSL